MALVFLCWFFILSIGSAKCEQLPLPPSEPRLSIRENQVIYSWDPPLYTGSAITGYKVAISLNGEEEEELVPPLITKYSIGVPPCSQLGIRVKTITDIGESVYTETPHFVTPVPHIQTLKGLRVTNIAPTKQLLEWTAPTNFPKSCSLFYRVFQNDESGNVNQIDFAEAGRHVVDGLQKNVTYTYSVAAVIGRHQEVKAQTASVKKRTTNFGVPFCPGGLKAIPKKAGILVSWEKPHYSTFAPTAYIAKFNISEKQLTVEVKISAMDNNVTLTEVESCNEYNISVYSTNDIGNCEWPEAVISHKLPSKPLRPKNFRLEQTKNKVGIIASWEAVELPTNQCSISYELIVKQSNRTTLVHDFIQAGNHEVGNIAGNVNITCSVQTIFSPGWIASDESNSVQITTIPNHVIDLQLVPSDDSIYVSWDRGRNGQDLPLAFTVSYTMDGTTKEEVTEKTSIEFYELQSCSSYFVSVKAFNAYGESPSSPTKSVTIPPKTPMELKVTGVEDYPTLNVKWTAPYSSSECPDLEYQLKETDSAGNVKIYNFSAASTHEIKYLQPRALYTYEVRSVLKDTQISSAYTLPKQATTGSGFVSSMSLFVILQLLLVQLSF